MEAQTLLKNSKDRFAHRPVQLVLVRANGPLFYSVAAASLLEAAAPSQAERMLHFFGRDSDSREWIERVWLPEKLARAKALREYVEATWPEFDWIAAHEQHLAAVNGEGGCGPQRATAAHEALARCVAAAQCGVFYRSLARWADDHKLREMACAMAKAEASSFTRFRRLHDERAPVDRFGFAAGWHTALSCVRAARDTQAARVFNAITAQCPPHAPFPALDYPEFLMRMRAVIERHGDLGTPERVLFRQWKNAPRAQVQAKKVCTPGWFKPFFPAAA